MPRAAARPRPGLHDELVRHARRQLAGRAIAIRPTAHNSKLSPVELTEENGKRHIQAVAPFSSASYASIVGTCPDSCPFKRSPDGEAGGCFADSGLMRVLMQKLDANALAYKLTADEIAEAEADRIDARWSGRGIPQDGYLGRGRDMRVHVGGDVATTHSARVLARSAHRYVYERGGGTIWTYTHWWREILREAFGCISVLASIERPEDALLALERGYAPALVVERHPSPKAFRLESAPGVRFVPCPAETVPGVTCVTCRLCLDRDLVAMRTGIAFAAHGNNAAKAKRKLHVLNPEIAALVDAEQIPDGSPEPEVNVPTVEPIVEDAEDRETSDEPPVEAVADSPGAEAGAPFIPSRGDHRIRRKRLNAWDDLAWEDHQECRDLVAANPDGMTLEQIGDVMGMTRERVRQIESEAIAKLLDVRAGQVLMGDRPMPVLLPRCDRCGDRFRREFGRQSRCSTCLRREYPLKSAQRRLFDELRRRRERRG